MHTPIHTVIHTTYLYMRDHGTLCNKDVCLSFRTSILCVVRITDTSILQWKLLTFSLSFKLFITCIHCVCVYTHMHMYALLMHRDWRTTCRSRFTPFTMQGSNRFTRDQIESSGLTASALTLQAISLCPSLLSFISASLFIQVHQPHATLKLYTNQSPTHKTIISRLSWHSHGILCTIVTIISWQ